MITEARNELRTGAAAGRRLATVGVLHTIAPDHWVPITLIARQRGWSKSETERAALQAGIGHVLSTLLIALVVWLAGVAFAQRFGHIVDTVSSLALIAFGGWFAVSAWRDLRLHASQLATLSGSYRYSSKHLEFVQLLLGDGNFLRIGR